MKNFLALIFLVFVVAVIYNLATETSSPTSPTATVDNAPPTLQNIRAARAPTQAAMGVSPVPQPPVKITPPPPDPSTLATAKLAALDDQIVPARKEAARCTGQLEMAKAKLLNHIHASPEYISASTAQEQADADMSKVNADPSLHWSRDSSAAAVFRAGQRLADVEKQAVAKDQTVPEAEKSLDAAQAKLQDLNLQRNEALAAVQVIREAKDTALAASQKAAAPPPKEKGFWDKKFTYRQYLQIKVGMTYADVVNILGENGVEMAQSGSGIFDSRLIVWDNGFMSNITLSFMNGTVDSKAQIGLR